MPTASLRAAAPGPDAPLETKGGDWQIKSLDDSGSFTGAFAAFGNCDLGNDIIEPGAFDNLKQFEIDGFVGVNHQMDRLPVAFPTKATQTSTGLIIEGRFHSHPEAQSCRAVLCERIAANKSVKGSIGYKTNDVRHEFRDGKSVRIIKSLSLHECSFVNIPMNPRADIMSAKSARTAAARSRDSTRGDSPGGDATPAAGPKVITIDALQAWIDEQKAGRVLSASNRSKLMEWHGGLSSLASSIKEFLESVADDGDLTDDDDCDDGKCNKDDDGGGEMAGVVPTAPKPKPKTKDRMDPSRIAGNAAAADDIPEGAATAGNMKADALRARKQQLLDDLRMRAVRVQTQFALMTGAKD